MNLIIESIGRPIEKDFSKTSVAHARNSVILSDIINADIVTCERDMHLADGKTYDNIICCYASPYMKYKKLIDIANRNPQAKLWWFVNDHDLEDNILLRNVLKDSNGKRKINMICNNSRENYRGWILRKKMKDHDGNLMGLLDDFIVEWHTLNLNALIYSYNIEYDWFDKAEDIIYYGTMRKWRLDYLRKYQSVIDFSCTSRTQKKFIANGVHQCRFTDKLSWQRGHERLRHYKFSLYVEDPHTHDHYAFMANRFYEALMCNVITIFDRSCLNTIKRSGYDGKYIDAAFIVDNKRQLKECVKHWGRQKNFEYALLQNDVFRLQAKKEHDDVVKQLQYIFKEV